jgi:hypothetical protein
MSNYIVPPQNGGVQTNTESWVELQNEEEAKNCFAKVKSRLLSINEWQHYAGNTTANFQLNDQNGNPVNRSPQKGDHFKIDIPAPGKKTGQGYDWVQVEDIEEKKDYVGIRVRPATDPTKDGNDVAHFFSDESTSTFVAKREGKKITAGSMDVTKNQIPKQKS